MKLDEFITAIACDVQKGVKDALMEFSVTTAGAEGVCHAKKRELETGLFVDFELHLPYAPVVWSDSVGFVTRVDLNDRVNHGTTVRFSVPMLNPALPK